MPKHERGSQLEAALSYYSSIVVTTAEGDSMVSGETLEGLGTTSSLLLSALFGCLFRIARPSALDYALFVPPAALSLPTFSEILSAPLSHFVPPSQPPARFVTSTSASKHNLGPTCQCASEAPKPVTMTEWALLVYSRMLQECMNQPQCPKCQELQQQQALEKSQKKKGLWKSNTSAMEEEPPPLPLSISPASSEPSNYEETTAGIANSGLTMLLPKSGYFVAGAVAGGVSRTATAPLDRLKVYLLVNTKTSTNAALAAAKSGRPLMAIRSAAKPVAEAISSLYAAGGLRTFFAGRSCSVPTHPDVMS